MNSLRIFSFRIEQLNNYLENIIAYRKLTLLGAIFMVYYCSKCNEDITSAEYKYSIEKYGSALCRKDQKGFSVAADDTVVREKDTESLTSLPNNGSNGLSKKDSTFVENMIKGRIAETLIEELFLQLNYSVFRYGMENTIPGVMKLLKGVRSDVATNIRRMPDFVVQNPNTGVVSFIEVKFRKSETFTFKDLGEDYPYENCYFIVVSKKHIKCVSYQELKEGKEVSPTSRNYLGNRKEFELDREVIIQFCEFALKFFETV